jgi:TRAP-type mannitol/chloroaromatic compound transport system permease large subunit
VFSGAIAVNKDSWDGLPEGVQAAMTEALAETLLSEPIRPLGFLILYLAPIIVLGFIIDSISTMLIVLPIARPVASAAGFDLSVFAITSAMNDPTLRVGEIFLGALPFVLAMGILLVVLAALPWRATWLARL